MSDEIMVKNQKGVATLLLNRPNVHNALSSEMMDQFIQTCKYLSEDPNVLVVLLTGAGDKSFCSGADLGGMGENNSIIEFKKHITKYRDCLLALRNLNKPVIGAINGYALAGGLGLASSCDLAYAKESAQFGAPEINVGLWGMMISASLLKNIGTKKTFELMYMGERIDARQAKQIGIINEVYNNDEFENKVFAIAQKLSEKNPISLSQGKESLHMIQNMNYESALTYLRDQVALLSKTEDYNEGIAAFQEKRKPNWTGR